MDESFVNKILVGDVLERLKELPAESIHTVVTSPPYWGLRDYGMPGQIGLEQTPEEYVAKLVSVFRQIRRVLRKDGIVWMNLGDSYANNPGSGRQGENGQRADRTFTAEESSRKGVPEGLKAKDLVGIPWRTAFALQSDGWYLRSDIIWAKPNIMPESVTDRPTKSHEYVFLMSRQAKYYYDATAIKEPDGGQDHRHRNVLEGQPSLCPPGQTTHRGLRTVAGRNGLGRNRRSVWFIPTHPFPDAHFAVFPQKLVEPCILAGTSEKGACSSCGAQYERRLERISEGKSRAVGKSAEKRKAGLVTGFSGYDDGSSCPEFRTIGWESSCSCDAQIAPSVVLDPFMGSGTTALVALKAGRNFVGVELNPRYAEMAERRISQELNQARLL